MGRRDESELILTEAELDAAEGATRQLLAPFGEPSAVEPPPGLAARVLAALPAARPTPALAPRSRRLGVWAAALVALLLAVGAWGVLVNSLGPARAVGGPAAGLGQLLLVLTLAAKPLLNLLAHTGLAAALLALIGMASAWLWWRIVRATPLVLPLEARP